MNKPNEKKASLVDILGSLKFSQNNVSGGEAECSTHFAPFRPRAPRAEVPSGEDYQLVRSAN